MLNYKKSDNFQKLINEYPNITDYLYSKNQKYRLLTNKVIVQLMAPRISLKHIAERGGYSFEELINIIEDGIKHKELVKDSVQKDNADITNTKEELKTLLKKLYKNEDVENVKRKFKSIVEKANPILIAVVEGELKQEGYSTEDLIKACDIHMELFKEQISSSRKKVSKDHPLWRFIKDHDAIMFWLEEGLKISIQMKKYEDHNEANNLVEKLKETMLKLKSSENHDVRQENTLFPILEKYGIEEPPSIMWQDHSNMKSTRLRIEKMLNEIKEKPYTEFVASLEGNFRYLIEVFAQHTKKEQEILYNVALDLLSEKDWNDIQKECDELGYFQLPKEVVHE